ncbi:neuralized-like protein 4 isoform X2 [Agrilus planipennis]|uniref:Neuralized-like protein 4 isoform X2 n=1 Tax=Agrilus planipennis TaxID=224129 RepID=A0A1W4XEK6_AGRPL|nr:neuralized-like protein 4 isoform X2 [Agrilus planipennis]
MAYFHYRCGERITLENDNCTAVRNDSDFDHGLVITAEPLVNDVLFEVRIDRMVSSWSGTLEIGVTEHDPLHFEFPPCASKLQTKTWILAGKSILKDGVLIVERYGADLDRLGQDDRVGLLRTSEGELIFYINGEPQGVAVDNLPSIVYGVVDLYGKCVQVTITGPILREHNNDDCLSGSSVLAIDNDILNVTLGADLSELSLSSSNSLDIRMDMNVSLTMPEETPRHDRLRFHERCGSLIKLTNGHRTAERRRPLDEFNNGVVMTHRPLRDAELFEIRIDRLVEKWSGSIEMGATTHNPSTLVFPATMTNMRSGTVMMSGCGILVNGKGTRREYGDFNLDELCEGDRVGMMRKPNGDLHYFINGLDQGIAAQRIPSTVWGVIDLYGMTIKVSIVERDEREEQNLMTRRNNRGEQRCPTPEMQFLSDYYDRLTFHSNCGAHAQVVNGGRTALRPNAADDFNNGVVLTSRPLKTGELFEVRLERVVTKWAGSIEIGVTTHSPTDLDFPFTMTNVRSGTWMMTGSGIMHNGTTVLEQYGVNLDRLQVGDRVGVIRKDSGVLHFLVNGIDQGAAATNVPEKVYGVIDLYGQAVEATIIDTMDTYSPDTVHSSLSNTTLYSDLRFHHVHGKNARIVNNGITALRPRPLAEFNDAIVFSSRPLRDGELFEVVLENIVERWSGSVELGITAVRPDEIDLPTTATDLTRDTWMLSGPCIMENGYTIKNNYSLDLDTLVTGARIGVMRTAEKTVEFYKDGIPQGPACVVSYPNIYAVIDLYGQCSQVSISCTSTSIPFTVIPPEACSETSPSAQLTSILQQKAEADLHRFHDCHGRGVVISEGGRVAIRGKELQHNIVFSSTPLNCDEVFEITIMSLMSHFAGTLCLGVTTTLPVSNITVFPQDACYMTENELRVKNKPCQLFAPSLEWLREGDHLGLQKCQDGTIKAFVNDTLFLTFPSISGELYVVAELKGSCCSIAVTSRKMPPTPLTNSHLQDSLELAFEQEMLKSQAAPPSEISEHNEQPDTSNIWYEFHDNHGRNIDIIGDKTSAKRVASYNQGVVIVQPPLQPEQVVKISLEQLDTKWSSSLIVGVVGCTNPERLSLPVTALSFKGPCCVIANDWISINGTKAKSNCTKLSNLKAGSLVGIKYSEQEGFVQIIVDGIAEEPVPWNLPKGLQCYAIFDLYGQCQQVKLVNAPEEGPKNIECEKANLELCEKDRSLINLTLPLNGIDDSPSTSSNQNSQSIFVSTPLKNSPCIYKQDCETLKKSLFLPEQYFVSDESVCYCSNCHKNIEEKQKFLIGWVKFPLHNFTSIAVQTEKWQSAYYCTKLNFVRSILDRGQPLSKSQEQWGTLVSQKKDNLQVLFKPTLENCTTEGFLMENKEVHAMFELLVKPGAYSVSQDGTEWCTKESGALILQGLLLKVNLK